MTQALAQRIRDRRRSNWSEDKRTNAPAVSRHSPPAGDAAGAANSDQDFAALIFSIFVIGIPMGALLGLICFLEYVNDH